MALNNIAPRGTKFILDSTLEFHQLYIDFFNIAFKFGCFPIWVPVLQYQSIFSVRDAGGFVNFDGSMYSLQDKSGRELVLKPENTLPIAHWYWTQGISFLKVVYLDRMYRYERPQKGRGREFFQGGVEFITRSKDKNILYPTLLMLIQFLNLKNISFKVLCNYRPKEIPGEYWSLIPEDMHEAWFRLLDKKDPRAMEVAPKILDFVTNEEIARFHRTINWMKAQNVEAVLDHSLVRGLSYYEGFIFEVVSGEHTVAGGGEYGLKCGSLSANACGFGIGVARLLESISSEKATTLPNLRTIFIEAKNGKLWQILAFDSLRLVDTQDARIRVYDDRIEVRGLDKNRYNVVPVERWLRFIGQ